MISIFILAYFSFVSTWLVTNTITLINPKSVRAATINKTLMPFSRLSGLDQIWALFSPTVNTYSSYSLVVIAFENGLLKLCELPRMEKLNILQKIENEKYRKFFSDNFRYPKYTIIRPAVSRFLARANFEPGNEVNRLSYFLISDPITPPEQLSKINTDAVLKTKIENYFIYGVDPKDK